MMLKAPERYLQSVISNAGVGKNLSHLIHHFICQCNKNLHFIIDEKEINLSEILTRYCHKLKGGRNFNFQVGQKVSQLKNSKIPYSKSALQCFFASYKIVSLEPQIILSNTDTPRRNIPSLEKFIPLSTYKIERVGVIQNRIEAFEKIFNASFQWDYFSNEKLLVVGSHNLFKRVSVDYPACFVSENENGETEIEYNSPLLPKIVFLKNINLLDSYQQQEINGNQVTFTTCIFVGSSKFENSINTIRNYYNQRRFTKAVFIGEKDIKVDLGNNQIPLRWKWTIPEITFFKGEKIIQHRRIIIQNSELEEAITDFYQAIREIENKHTVSLKSIYRFIRRIYFDWNLKQETTVAKLHKVQEEFGLALKQLLIETLGNIFPDFDFDEYYTLLTAKFARILEAVKSNNKTEKLKKYQNKIHQLILPSFLCSVNKSELNEIAKQIQPNVSVHNLHDILKLQSAATQHQNNPNRPYYCLTANGAKSEIVSLTKSDACNEGYCKLISSI